MLRAAFNNASFHPVEDEEVGEPCDPASPHALQTGMIQFVHRPTFRLFTQESERRIHAVVESERLIQAVTRNVQGGLIDVRIGSGEDAESILHGFAWRALMRPRSARFLLAA